MSGDDVNALLAAIVDWWGTMHPNPAAGDDADDGAFTDWLSEGIAAVVELLEQTKLQVSRAQKGQTEPPARVDILLGQLEDWSPEERRQVLWQLMNWPPNQG